MLDRSKGGKQNNFLEGKILCDRFNKMHECVYKIELSMCIFYKVWTELKSFDGGGSFRFETDMTVPDDANFGDGEPNGGAGELCVDLVTVPDYYTSYTGGFALNDVECSRMFNIVCECKEFN